MILPENTAKLIEKIEENGYSAYVVGGSIRDILRGVSANDWDISSSASPDEIEKIFFDYKVIPTGREFGTMTVIFGGEIFEITMFRGENSYDGRKPKNVCSVGTIEEDLARRDFTVNALAYNPKTGIIDLFGGISDIKNHILKAVGDAEKRFGEDALRILRALRFSACLGYFLEENTRNALFKCSDKISFLSRERIWQELQKMICGEFAPDVFLQYSQIFRNISESWNDFEFSAEDAEKFAEFSDIYGKLAFILSKLSQKEKALRELACPSVLKKRIEKIWQALCEFSEEDFPIWIASFKKEFRREDGISALILAGKNNKISEFLAILDSEIALDLEDLCINGDELQTLGIPKGRKIGEVLNRILVLVMKGELENSKQNIQNFVKKIVMEI